MRFFIYLVVTVFVVFLSGTYSYGEANPEGLFAVGKDNVEVHCYGENFDIPCYMVAPDGKKLGRDGINDESYHEVNGSWGGGAFCPKCEPSSYEGIFNLIDGEHFIRLTAKGLTPYYLTVSIFSSSLDEGKVIEMIGVTDIGRISEYKFNFSTESSDLWKATRIATPVALSRI